MKTRLLIIPLLLPLAGCASFGGHLAKLLHIERPAKLEVRAAASPIASVPASTAVDRLYRQARTKIEARAYADALELLQLARATAPDDPRLLNAMGVVYDKIGRLDLSGRYYELALAHEPGSTVVLANMRYSTAIGTRLAAIETGRLLPTAPAAAAPAEPTIRAAAEPQRNAEGAIVLAAAPPAVTVLHAGRPVVIIDASGKPDGPAAVRTYLASAGWSVADETTEAAAQAPSEIRYPKQHRLLAEALARTLPFKVSLSDCGPRCAGLELVLGQETPSRLKTFTKEQS